MSYHRVHTLPSLWRLGCTSTFEVCGWYCTVLLSVHIDVVWCGYNGLRFMYVCTVCIPRWKYPSSIHYVSIPHIQYNTYIHIHLYNRPPYSRYSTVGTYARPAYQPDDSPQTQSRKAKQPKPATSRLAESGGNRHGKRATKLLYTRKLVVRVVSLPPSVARYTFDSLLPQVPSSEYYEKLPDPKN